MMKVYALLIRKWMDELQESQWEGTIKHFEKQERKQQEYTYKRTPANYNK